MVDYSKWNNIDLSDDDSDCHPNIEKNTWLRLKKETKQRKAEEERQRKANEASENEANVKRAAELEAKLKANPEDAATKADLSKVKGKIDVYLKKKAQEEELEKKYPKWDDDNICREGFSKTVVNRSDGSAKVTVVGKPSELVEKAGSSTAAGAAAPQPTVIKTVEAPAPAPAPKKITDNVKVPETIVPGVATAAFTSKPASAESEEDAKEYIRQMELKAHKFAGSKNYDEYFERIKEYPEIVTRETNTYLLLHCSDCLKKGKEELSKKYLRGACIIQYCVELGGNGVNLFFARMRDPNPKFREEFERETLAYWHRIREKLPELKKLGEKRGEVEEMVGEDDEMVELEEVDPADYADDEA